MKLGTMIIFNEQINFEEKFNSVKELGLPSCQLTSWNPSLWTDENVRSICNASKKTGVEISAFWCGWTGPVIWDFYDGQITLGLVPAEYRQMRVEQLCAGADFAKKLGVTDVITHMGFIPENPNDPNFAPFCVAVRTVSKHLKKNGQNLLFETGQETPVTMLRCFEKVGTDNLFVNLDTANVILYGKANPVDALDVFGKYVRNIHAKDGFYPTNGHDLGVEVRIGDGKADFERLFRKLKELDYHRYVTIEREIDGDKQTEDIIYAKKYLEDIITRVYGVDELC
ncbi:MAG: sugar phosphate isomerase/epimerase [Clostridia bacterium]|nr:sugar phosphate isomerase/epimerase [Clostridia bacterium]